MSRAFHDLDRDCFTMQGMSLRRLVASTLIASFTLGACGGKSADTSLASAKAYLAKNDLRAAVIELKNALQAKSDLGEARVLLGKALLDLEEPVAAEVELRKAQGLKVSDDQVAPLLATALLQSGEPRKVIDLDTVTVLTVPEAVASLKASVALAHATLGNDEKADAALSAALKAKNDYAPALLQRARALAGKRDFEAAAKVVDDVLAREPGNADALALKGDLLQFALDDASGATETYRKALAGKPGHVAAHAGLLTQLLGKNDLDGARKQLETLKRLRPQHPQSLYFQARVEAQAGDLKAADEALQQLLKYPVAIPQVLELAGAVSMQRGELLQAEQHFSKLIQVAPRSDGARHMLARIYLGTGEPDKALATLEPLLQAASRDAQTLLLAGRSYMASGDVKKAEELFGLAVKAAPGDPMGRTALAQMRIQRGDFSEGLPQLEAIASADGGTAADMALISAHINRSNYDAALKAIDKLEKKLPGKPLAPHLRAGVLALRGDMAGARDSYGKALAADATYFPSIEGLAALDVRERKADQARARFDALLKVDPNNVRAISFLARLDEQAGKPKQEVAATLAKAIAIKPGDPTLRRQLIHFHQRKEDHKLALVAAQEAVSALPNDPDMVALLAGAQLVAGDTNQAITSYNKAVTMRPKSPAPLIALAEAHLVAKSYDAAADAVKKALVLAPDSAAVVQTAARIDAQAGRHDQALNKARALQAREPAAPHGWLIEGDVEIARRNWPAAVAAFRVALQKQDATLIAQRLYMGLRNSGEKAKAEAFAVEWLKKHPQDSTFLFNLATWAIADRELEVAMTRLEEVLRNTPDSVAALNNLAWVQATLKKPGAVANAERVNQLLPNQPVYMDTLAYALAADGKIDRAIEVQKKVLELAPPSSHGFRLQMARLYLQAGNTSAARAELDALAKLGDQFPQQSEVRELQSKL
jgi:putative PEP-CTERM system TPR-repeat lipoprotein